MGQALYRKYRSKKLSEIVGQEHITTTLANALKKGSISHAYLFTGPRGVGKTSIARILAHEVNKLPYDEAATHLDIIEIDAASNRRIDEIRTLRERVHNTPASAQYKVYIIDEVHMLTKEAFNALLKTLEEPPAHAIFILATTEAHKLPETIISRTQRFTFKPVESNKAVKHLRHIASEEKIDISDEALELIAKHGGGSFRDSISLLDQLSSTSAVVDLAAAQKALGIAPDEAIARLLSTLQKGNADELLTGIKDLYEQGYQASQIAKQLARQLRSGLIGGNTPLEPQITSKILQQLIDVPASHDPNALLEIILLDVVLQRSGNTPAAPAPQPIAASPPKIEKPAPKPEQKPVAEKPKQAESAIEPKANKPKPTGNADLDESAWNEVLQTLKKKHNTLYGIARMATPLFQGEELTLSFAFPFHQKRLNDAKNKQILIDILHSNTGKSVDIICVTEAKPKAPKATDVEEKSIDSPDALKTISNIFGDAEVLE